MPANQITIDNGSLMLTYSNGTSESYSMTKVPGPTTGWVIAAKQEILHTMSLEGMLRDLDRASDLIYIAYNGVVGTGSLAASVSGKQKELGVLCRDCVVLMQDFIQVTHDVLWSLKEAYKQLTLAQEARALAILGRCADKATAMAKSCGELATRFATLRDEVQKDATSTEVLVGSQNERVKQLEQLKLELKASLAGQQKLQEELDAALDDLNARIVEATAREDKEAERAFITGIISGIAGALSQAASAYFTASNPAAAAGAGLANRTSPPSAAGTPPKAAAPAATPPPAKAEGAKTEAAPGTTKAKESNAAPSAAAAAAGAGAASIAGTTDAMANQADNRTESLRSERLKLIELKMEQQKQRRAAAANVSELTAKLGNNAQEMGSAQASLDALQIAVWAFSGIYVALLNAESFWKNLAAYCARLGRPELINQVKDETEFVSTASERVAYYTGSDFVLQAVAYLARWAALESIGQDYLESANKAYTKVTDNIEASPNIEEASRQLKRLKADFQTISREYQRHLDAQSAALLAEQQTLLSQEAA